MPAAKKTTVTAGADAALKKWEEKFGKTFGADTLIRATEMPDTYEFISTGSLDLDYKLGGGLVEGRLHEVWGPEGVGKTTLALMMIAEAQRKYPRKVCAFIDMEHKLDKRWAADHGVDLTRLHIFDPETAEDVADALKDFCRSGFHSFIALDSIGGMIPKAEMEKDAGDAVVGKQAGIVTRMVKLNAVEASRTGATVLLINQVRANLAYGADTTTGGGFALKHATTTKLKMRRTSQSALKLKIAGEDRIVGHEVAITIERLGVANAYRTAMVTMTYVPTTKYGPIGIDVADEAATLGINLKIIDQGGAWYTLPVTGERLQGRDSVVEALRVNPEIIAHIRAETLKTSDVTVEDVPTESAQDDNFTRGNPE